MKISKNLIPNILILFFLIKPQLFLFIDALDKIMDSCQFFTIFLVIILYIKNILSKEKRISFFTILCIIFSAILIVSTIINSGNLFGCLAMCFQMIALVMFTEILINKNVELMFKSYITLFDIYLILNTITLFFPNGVVQTNSSAIFFLGGDNRFIFYYLPLVFFRFGYSYLKYDHLKKSDIIIYLICLLTLIYRWSVGAMLGLLLYVPFILFIVNNKSLDKIFNLFNYLVVMLITNYALVVFQIQTYFQDFIVNVLHKDVMLSYRTLVWERTLSWIYKYPIIGNGYEYPNVVMAKNRGANHPHNYMLTLLYRGGILYFLTFIVMILLTYLKMRKYKNLKIVRIIAFSILVMLFMSLADSFDFAVFFVFFQIGYMIEKIYKEFNENI